MFATPLIPRIDHSRRSAPAPLPLAQDDVTAAANNHRPAKHRTRAGNIRKDQVTDQAGPENINILETKECLSLSS